MENPVSAVKSAFNLNTLIKFAALFLVFNAVLELIGFSDLFYNPVSYLRAKFGK